MSPAREEKLVKLGFVWRGETEQKKTTAWDSLYKKFKVLKEKYTDAYTVIIKRKYPELDHWVSRQLHNKEKLSADKKKKLNDIGFSWKRSKVHRDQLWEEMYQQLVAYKKQCGHCDVPQKYPANAKLAQWVNGQRSKKLSAEKRNKLDRIGFSWSGEIKQKRWFQRLDEFKELQRKNKLDTIRAHMPLHSWIYQQKKNFHRMSAEKKKILLKVGIVSRHK